MRRVHLAEFAFRDSFVQQFPHAAGRSAENKSSPAGRCAAIALARPHHLALHQLGINLVGGDEIEIRSHVGQNLFPRRQVAVEHPENVAFIPENASSSTAP